MSPSTPSRHFTRTFLAGLLAALPLVATVGVFAWLAQLIYGWLGPQSLIGGLFVQLGLSLSDSERAGYLLGVLIILGAIYALGLLVEAQLQDGLARVVNLILAASRWCATSTTSSTALSTCWDSATRTASSR